MPLPPVRPASPAAGQRHPPAGTTGHGRLESKSEPIPVRFERGHVSRRLIR
jgi:hypothetical protein